MAETKNNTNVIDPLKAVRMVQEAMEHATATPSDDASTAKLAQIQAILESSGHADDADPVTDVRLLLARYDQLAWAMDKMSRR